MELEILNRTIIQDTFTYKNFSLEYLKIGNGSKIILYFHGYGKNAKEFFDYETGGLTNFTVYSINFFHHGNSAYPGEKIHYNTLSKDEWKEIMEAFLQANK